ncbi:MAG: hypothetical protein IJJ33_16415 [Victivallales bacterium]|nr:hypothetical protein [Victivallales bacterium]
MKAILINANERKVVAVDVKPDPNKDLDGLRALIGCEWVQPVVVGEGMTIWVDEEGRLKQPKAGFLLSGVPCVFVGNGVLRGGDASRAKACRAAAEVVALGVTWLAPEAVSPPEPAQFFVLP